MRTLIAAACGCLAMLALAAPALAEPGVAPKKATNYAAGDIAGTFQTGNLMLSSVAVRSGGKKVDVLMRVAGGVDSSCSYVAAGGATASLRKDGTFSATVPLQKYADDAKPGSLTVKGEFVADEGFAAVVGLTVSGKVPVSATKTCPVKSVDLVAVDPSRGLVGKAAKKAFFVGLLDAKSSLVPVKLPFAMKLSSNGKALDTAFTTLGAKCTPSGDVYTSGLLAVTNDPITGSSLSAQDSSSFTTSTGRAIVVTILKGSFASRKLTGTFQVTRTDQNADGTVTNDTCDSGAVKYTATRIK